MSKNPLTPRELSELRDRLDAIDTGIIDLIAERLDVVKSIGDHKLKTGIPLRHYAREREVIDRGMARAESMGLSGQVAREILETLIHYCCRDRSLLGMQSDLLGAASFGIENLLLGLKDRYVLMVVSHSLEQAARLADRIAVAANLHQSTGEVKGAAGLGGKILGDIISGM